MFAFLGKATLDFIEKSFYYDFSIAFFETN